MKKNPANTSKKQSAIDHGKAHDMAKSTKDKIDNHKSGSHKDKKGKM